MDDTPRKKEFQLTNRISYIQTDEEEEFQCDGDCDKCNLIDDCCDWDDDEDDED